MMTTATLTHTCGDGTVISMTWSHEGTRQGVREVVAINGHVYTGSTGFRRTVGGVEYAVVDRWGVPASKIDATKASVFAACEAAQVEDGESMMARLGALGVGE